MYNIPKSSNKAIFCIVVAIIFVAIFTLNYFFPIYADDMLYSVIKYKETFDLSRAFHETIQFLDLYYFTWGGRLSAHLLAFVLLMFDKIPLSIIKSLGYILLVYYSYKLVKTDKQSNLCLFSFFAICYFYFTPSFLSSAVWTTGNANYMGMITFTVIYLYCLKKYMLVGHKHLNFVQIILLSLLSLFVGCTNENLAPVIIVLLVALVIIQYIQKRNFNKYIYVSILLVIIGCAIMVFAPGNAMRAAKEGYPSLFNSMDVMSTRLGSIHASYRYFMLRPLIIYPIALILFFLFPKREASIKDTILYSVLMLVIANLSIWLTLLSPSFPPRAFMSITVLTFIAIGILYAQIDFSQMIPLVVNCLFFVVLLFFAGKDYLTFLKGSYFLNQVMKQRIEVIDQAKVAGKNEIYLEKVYLDYRFEYSDFSNYYQDYYGLKVSFVEKGDPNLTIK